MNRPACSFNKRLCGPSMPFYIQHVQGIPGDCQFESLKIVANSDPKYQKVDVTELRRACATAIATSISDNELLVIREHVPLEHISENWVNMMPRELTIPQFRLYLAKSVLPKGDYWGDSITLPILSNYLGIRLIIIDGNCSLQFVTDSPFPEAPVAILRYEGLHYEPIFTMNPDARSEAKKFLFKYNSKCIQSVLAQYN